MLVHSHRESAPRCTPCDPLARSWAASTGWPGFQRERLLEALCRKGPGSSAASVQVGGVHHSMAPVGGRRSMARGPRCAR